MNWFAKFIRNLTPRYKSRIVKKLEIKHEGVDLYYFSIELREKTDSAEQYILMTFSTPDAFNNVRLFRHEFEQLTLGVERIMRKIS